MWKPPLYLHTVFSHTVSSTRKWKLTLPNVNRISFTFISTPEGARSLYREVENKMNHFVITISSKLLIRITWNFQQTWSKMIIVFSQNIEQKFLHLAEISAKMWFWKLFFFSFDMENSNISSKFFYQKEFPYKILKNNRTKIYYCFGFKIWWEAFEVCLVY